MIPSQPESIITKPDVTISDPASVSPGQEVSGAEGLITLLNANTELAQNLARQSAALMGALGVRELGVRDVPLSNLQIAVTPFEDGLFNDLCGAGSATVYNLKIATQNIDTILKILGEYYKK